MGCSLCSKNKNGIMLRVILLFFSRDLMVGWCSFLKKLDKINVRVNVGVVRVILVSVEVSFGVWKRFFSGFWKVYRSLLLRILVSKVVNNVWCR